MAFPKSKFLTFFLLFCSLHLAFASEEIQDNPITQNEIVGQRLPSVQDCCNYGRSGNCGGGDYCNPPPCEQNGCGGCTQNPSNRCGGGSACQPYPPSCQVQGPCQSCGRVRSNVKVESDHSSSEPMP